MPYTFKKPFTAKLDAKNITTGTWDGSPTLGTAQEYKLTPQVHSSLTSSSISNYTLGNLTSNTIQHFGDNIILKDTKVNIPTLTDFSGTRFRTRIDSSVDATQLNPNPQIQVVGATISYTFGGGNVVYPLSDKPDDFTINRIRSANGDDFFGVKIIGELQ